MANLFVIDSTFSALHFRSLFESSQSLFWASFGMVGLENFELLGIKSYTRFWGLMMYGSYSIINVIVLLNLLIAMVCSASDFSKEFRLNSLLAMKFHFRCRILTP